MKSAQVTQTLHNTRSKLNLTTVIMQQQQQQQQQQINQEEQQNLPSPLESKLTSELANDRPTIDAAIKSFISLVTAQSLTATVTDVTMSSTLLAIVNNNSNSNVSADRNNSVSIQQQVLQLARVILKTINAYQFSLPDTVAATRAEKTSLSPEKKLHWIELGVTARLWNGLVQSEQKPSRYLGRRALQHAWPKMDVKSKILSHSIKGDGDNNNHQDDPLVVVIRERQLQWLQQFETLLFRDPPIYPVHTQEEDDDSALLWSPDKGAAELAKRRQRRQDAAKERGPSTPS
jgi:hypothetical protein